MTKVEPGPILIVDDDADQRTVLGILLETQGYTVLTMEGGASALRYLREGGRPRLIVLDLSMPDVSGAQMHTELQRDPTLAEIPVIILSGVAEFAVLPNVVAKVTKGADPGELLRIVAAASGAAPRTLRG